MPAPAAPTTDQESNTSTEAAEAAAAAAAAESKSPDPWEKFPAEFNWVRKELETARQEAAAKRVEAKELSTKLAAAKTPEEVQQITADYDKKLAARETENLRLRLAREAQLPTDLDEFITGSTEDEIKTQVAKLVGLKPAKDGDPNPVVVTQQAPRGGSNPSQQPNELDGHAEYEKWKKSRR